MTDSMGFLIADVTHLMRRRFDARARTIGVTRAQWRTLTTLARNEGINQGGLADLLEVEPITLCRMIDRLEEAGLVERRRDPADRRAWRIHLTEQAHPIIAQLREMADAMFVQALQGIDTDARERFIDTLQTIRANLTVDEHQPEAAHG